MTAPEAGYPASAGHQANMERPANTNPQACTERPAGQVAIRSFPLGLLGANAYLVTADGSSVLIDPGGDPGRSTPDLPPLDAIICTHGHFDHIAGADVFRRRTGAPLLIHAADARALTDPLVNASVMAGQPLRLHAADRLVQDGEELALGTSHCLRVLATPGHTPGGICLLLLERCEPGAPFNVDPGAPANIEPGAPFNGRPVAVFSGDTLFLSSIGRLDIGGDARAMQASLERLMQLPDSLPVYPGHGPATSIGLERRKNPYLQPGVSLVDDLD